MMTCYDAIIAIKWGEGLMGTNVEISQFTVCGINTKYSTFLKM